jgi:hypothetical protein
MSVHRIEWCRYIPGKKQLIGKNRTKYIAICPVCGNTQHYDKLQSSRFDSTYCKKCTEGQEVFKLQITGHLHKKKNKTAGNKKDDQEISQVKRDLSYEDLVQKGIYYFGGVIVAPINDKVQPKEIKGLRRI